MSRLLVLVLVACVRAPAPLDVDALVAARGPVEARRALELRVLDSPRDIAARLALAALAERTSRPGEALEQLAAVEQLGGPLGPRWHDADRARYAKLLAARGDVRAARQSASALGDLEHARKLGERIDGPLEERARLAIAIADLRHVDGDVRARGRVRLAQAHERGPGLVSPEQHGLFGLWLWQRGAKREAYEQLAAWHAAPHAEDRALECAYLQAFAWWTPVDAPEPREACADAPRDAPMPPHTDSTMPPVGEEVFAAAVARYARADALVPIVRAYRRDPAIGERLGRDFVAESIDAAAAHAALGAMFDALGDPGRARPEWQAAVDATPDVEYMRGLALAAARGGDAPAAAVFATRAAAASGDPVIVWIALARALEESGQHVDALAAARSALELASRTTIGDALAVAIAASRALGRDAQASALVAQRARYTVPSAGTDLEDALYAYRARPNATSIARLWVVSREHPHDVASRAAIFAATSPGDPRRGAVAGELAALAGGDDRDLALDAVRALAPR